MDNTNGSNADYCGLGACSAEDGHEGTCAEASGWSDEPDYLVVDTSNLGPSDDGDGEPVRNVLPSNVRAEAHRRYHDDWIVSEVTGEEERHDDWGYSETARAAFVAGALWAASRS